MLKDDPVDRRSGRSMLECRVEWKMELRARGGGWYLTAASGWGGSWNSANLA